MPAGIQNLAFCWTAEDPLTDKLIRMQELWSEWQARKEAETVGDDNGASRPQPAKEKKYGNGAAGRGGSSPRPDLIPCGQGGCVDGFIGRDECSCLLAWEARADDCGACSGGLLENGLECGCVKAKRTGKENKTHYSDGRLKPPVLGMVA
jgi:hypothetical protein